MGSTASIAASGMQAAQVQLASSAHNVANVETPAFKRQRVMQTEQAQGGVATQVGRAERQGAALEADVVDQLQAKNAFLANLSVFKTSDKMAGALFKTKI